MRIDINSAVMQTQGYQTIVSATLGTISDGLSIAEPRSCGPYPVNATQKPQPSASADSGSDRRTRFQRPMVVCNSIQKVWVYIAIRYHDLQANPAFGRYSNTSYLLPRVLCSGDAGQPIAHAEKVQ